MTHWFNPSTLHFTSSTWGHSRFRSKKARSSIHHKHVKQYRLLHELGHGSTCTIYLARNMKTKQLYVMSKAVKEMSMAKLQRQACMDWLQARNPKQQHGDGCKRRRIETPLLPTANDCTESTLLQSLQHENILEWVDCFEENNNLYLVTEWIDGSVLVNLHQHDDRDNDRTSALLDSSNFHSVFTQLVFALDYLHNKNIIHGDIKPDNVLLTKTDQIKLIDFGSAIQLNASANTDHNSDIIFKQPTQRRRTPAFTPPECNSNNKKDYANCNSDARTIKQYETATDVWCLGLTLYCMVYGKLPYDHRSTSHTDKDMHPNDLLAKCIPHQDTVDRDLRDLIDQMLTEAPMERITLDQIKQHPWFLKENANTDTTT